MSYTLQHVNAYFDRIDHPHDVRRKFMQPAGGINSLEALTSLLHHQTAAVPFENTVVHYSTDRLLTLTPNLGYDAYTTCARINVNTSAAAVAKDPSKPLYGDWSHMLIIVKIDGEDYVVDANFGPNAPINPVPLCDGYEFDDFDGRRGKICTAPIAQNKATHLKYWHIQLRDKEQKPWIMSYIFNEHEFLDGDYQALERSFRANKRSWFLYKVMAFRFVLDRWTRKPVGWILLWENHLKEKMNGKFHFKTIQSESERIDLLEEKFEIVLEDEEKREIIGTLACMPKIDADSQPKQIKDDTSSATRARL